VGDYIAAAVLSIAFGRPYAVVDGNVKRVLARLMCIELPVNVQKHHAKYQYQADKLLDPAQPSLFNQALMEIGALICRPTKPRCDRCPLKAACCALAGGRVSVFPHRQARAKVPIRQLAVAVIRRRGKLLFTRRPEAGLLGGLWEFPNSVRHTGESTEDACRRLAGDQLGLEIRPCRKITRIQHAYTHFKIQAEAFLCDAPHGPVHLNGPTAFRWSPPAAIDNFALHKAMHKLLPALRRIL
jgi:A/G-specific adenine glycosylase